MLGGRRRKRANKHFFSLSLFPVDVLWSVLRRLFADLVEHKTLNVPYVDDGFRVCHAPSGSADEHRDRVRCIPRRTLDHWQA